MKPYDDDIKVVCAFRKKTLSVNIGKLCIIDFDEVSSELVLKMRQSLLQKMRFYVVYFLGKAGIIKVYAPPGVRTELKVNFD